MKKRFLLLLALSTAVCSGCSLIDILNKSLVEFYSENHNNDINFDDGDEPSVVVSDDVTQFYGAQLPYNLRDVSKSMGSDSLSSVGESKILVVPVNIAGQTQWNRTMLDNIYTVFFGSKESLAYESVASYYETASYGRLKLSGEIAPVFNTTYTVSSLINNAPVIFDNKMPDQLIISQWINDHTYDELRKKYDVDHDNYLDSVVFVYNAPIDIDNGFWAWVYWYEDSQFRTAPKINTYMWISYFFSTGNNNFSKIKNDAHTFIHETGHMLGLDDYYPYEDELLDVSGSLDMHSQAVGDENPYSKFMLGWMDPYYVKTENSVTIELKSSAVSSSSILLNDNWNGTPFDEYILIDYYTPQANNDYDSKHFSIYGNKMYDKCGVRIYHIDSRLVKAISNTDVIFDSVSSLNSLMSSSHTIGPSNSPSRAYLPSGSNENLRRVSLIDGKNRPNFYVPQGKESYKGYADNDTLFFQGQSFIPNSTFFINGDNFNNGSKIGYKVIVNSCQNKYASITIEKI